ncbi:hypothetical protein A2U01_0006609 [Trifolium medium]|uniref:Uncharacterized protein n=1 Tax=Trifolium medium TaxID=97028 RepID=A0A392MFD7_9FABA|nr:hypothetical protein [Trifolium medium]
MQRRAQVFVAWDPSAGAFDFDKVKNLPSTMLAVERQDTGKGGCSMQLPRTFQQVGIRAVVRFGERAGGDPGIGSTIGCENSHLGWGMLDFKCE